MSTEATYQMRSTSSEDTERAAEKIGARLKGGEVIELSSDLGGGKTTFVHGLARGAGSSDHVASPTFTISRQYRAPKFTIHHFDFFRIEDAGLMKHELAEYINDPKSVVVVEWAGVIKDVLPEKYLQVDIKLTGENEREITFTCPEDLNYLPEDVDTNN